MQKTNKKTSLEGWFKYKKDKFLKEFNTDAM
jgi:hypothetical protein